MDERTASYTIPGEFLVPDISDKLSIIAPYMAPLDTMLNLMVETTERAYNTTVSWDTVRFEYPSAKVLQNSTASATGSTATVMVGNQSRNFKKYDVLMVKSSSNPNIKNVQVVSTTDNSIEIALREAQSYGSVPGLQVNDELILVSPAFPEGSCEPTGRSVFPTRDFNYTQIIKYGVDYTGTAEELRNYTEVSVEAIQFENMAYIQRRADEINLWFGERTITDTVNANGKREVVRTKGGIMHYIGASPNVLTFTNELLNYSTIQSWMERIFSEGSGARERCFFVASGLSRQISGVGAQNSTFFKKNDELSGALGYTVLTLENSQGILHIIENPIFNTSMNSASGVILDIEGSQGISNIRKRPLRAPRLIERGIETTGCDTTNMQLIFEESVEVRNTQDHWLIRPL